MEGHLQPVRMPKVFEESFGMLSGVTLYFMDYILRGGRRGSWRKKVIVVTSHAVFICACDGNINRCIPLKEVTEVVYGGSQQFVVLVVPTENDQKSFDVLLRSSENLPLLINVLQNLTYGRRLEVGRPATQFKVVENTQAFPLQAFNFTRPDGWKMKLDKEMINCVTTGTPQPPSQPRQTTHQFHSFPPPGTPHNYNGPSWKHSQREDEAAATIQRAVRDKYIPTPARSQSASPSPKRQSDDQQVQSLILKKLESMEREIQELKKASRQASPAAADHKTREMSLRSYDEVKAIRQELASEGLIAPSSTWNEIFSPTKRGRSAKQGAIPGRKNGVDGYFVPASSPMANYREPEYDDDLPPGAGSGGGGGGAYQNTSSPMNDTRCWNCRRDLTAEDVLPRCSGCRVAVYCGRQCQTVHWSYHKSECQHLSGGGMQSGGGLPPTRNTERGGRYSHQPEQQIIVVDQRHNGEIAQLRPQKTSASSPSNIPPPPPGPPPTSSHLAPDAIRDGVHSHDVIKQATRPQPPPAPSTKELPDSVEQYDHLFNTYRDYYTGLMSGSDPIPPPDIYS
eukprot:TRINITY_DN15594_c0_g1_i1.p1 TRINITY_DN15594_c0_g1~~TRINITY_DN15594_c0_g1_i1.p1  ORF type:complete len:583 (+),score=136.93 TRINITY_DN15594_c0_g1_i1:52-1749(+)